MSGWAKVKLGQVAEFINGDRGKNYPSEGDFVDQGIPFINAGHLTDGKVVFSNMNYISESRFHLLGSGKTRMNDILYCLRGSLGKTAIVRQKGDAAIASSLVIIRPSDDCSVEYLYHFLTSPFAKIELRKFDNGSSQPNLSASSVKNYVLPLPPLAEQRRIAEALNRAETLGAKRRAALAQLDTLTQSIFLDLFGDPKFNERDWPLCRIGSVISDLRGGANLAPEDFVESGFPILHKGAIKPNGMVSLDAKKKTFATQEYATANRRFQIDNRYLAVTLRDLVPTGPSIGLIANLQDGPFDGYLLAQGAYGFRVNSSKVTPEYLVFLSNMPTFRHVLRKYAVGSTQIHIRTPVYLDIPIPIPPLSSQHEFTRRVAAVKRLGAT